jgi:hypothetical protein
MLLSSVLEGEQKSCAIWYVIFRQSPKRTGDPKAEDCWSTQRRALVPVAEAMAAVLDFVSRPLWSRSENAG